MTESGKMIGACIMHGRLKVKFFSVRTVNAYGSVEL